VVVTGADHAQFIRPPVNQRDVDRQQRQRRAQRGAAGEQSPAVGNAAHAGDEPDGHVEITKRGCFGAVQPDHVDDRDGPVDRGHARGEAGGGGDPIQHRHRGQHQHIGAQEPQQLDTDAGYRLVDVPG
jgi:hypothetical protein